MKTRMGDEELKEIAKFAVAQAKDIETKSNLAEEIYGKFWFPFEDFDTENFFNFISALARIYTDKWDMVVLEPNITSYFQKNVGVIPVTSSEFIRGYQDYKSFIRHEPDLSPGDAIIYNAKKILFCSRNGNWFMLLSQTHELGRFISKVDFSGIENTQNFAGVNSIEEAIEEFLPTFTGSISESEFELKDFQL